MRQRARSKWWLVGAYWIVQALAIFFVTPAWAVSAGNVDPDQGNLGAFSWTEYAELAFTIEWALWAALVVGVLTALQLVFVWPVRKPVPKRERGWPIWISLGIASLAVASLSTALMLAISQGIYTFTGFDLISEFDIKIRAEWGVAAWCLVSWAIATPLLVRFCRNGPRESLLARVSSRLFVGTVIEIAAIIPLDVLVRKRESCYCWAGTYFGLTICGAVGLFVLGPAIFLPLVVRRRRRWHEGRCESCGYDMSATPKADRCPECGLGWRVGE